MRGILISMERDRGQVSISVAGTVFCFLCAVHTVTAASWCVRSACLATFRDSPSAACVVVCGTEEIDFPASGGELSRMCTTSPTHVSCGTSYITPIQQDMIVSPLVPTVLPDQGTVFPAGVPLTVSPSVYDTGGALFSLTPLNITVRTSSVTQTNTSLGTVPQTQAYTPYTPAYVTNALPNVPTPQPDITAPTPVSTGVVPSVVTYASTSLEDLILELGRNETSQSLVDHVRDILPSLPSPVGTFDRVVYGGQRADVALPLRAGVQDAYAALRTSCTAGALFAKRLMMGGDDTEVRTLQTFLNAVTETRIAEDGPGSPGNETTRYGSLTTTAVQKFQTLYAADILTPLGLSAPTGEWGAKTRAKANQLVCGTK